MPGPSAFKPDPQVFAGAFLAGMEASGTNRQYSARLSLLKENWHVYRQFCEWIVSGEDVREYEAKMAAEAARAAKAAEVERIDREAAERRKLEATAAHGAK